MSLKIWREFYTMSHCPQYKEEFTIAGCDSSARKGESRRRGWEQVNFFKTSVVLPSILDFFHLTLDSCMCSWHDWVISLYKDFLMFSVKLKLIFQLFWRWSKQSWVAVPRPAAGEEAKEKAREEKETTLELSGRWKKQKITTMGILSIPKV